MDANQKKCEHAGCENPASIHMGQSSSWDMLFPGPDHKAWLCESCATDCERVGGVRL